MNPIISPWFIYLLSFVDQLKVLLGITSIVSGVALMAYIIGLAAAADWERSFSGSEALKYWKDGWKPYKRKLTILFPLVLTLAVLIPDRSTIIQMYIADNITWDRIEKTVEIGKDVKDEIKRDIIDIIDSINKQEGSK